MTSLKVKLKSVDRSSRYLYPSRTLELTHQNVTIQTPSRAATLYEFREKAMVPTDIPINNPALLNVRRLSAKNLSLLMTNDGYRDLFDKISRANILTQYSMFKSFLLQPTVTAQKGQKSAMAILKEGPKLLDNFLRLLIQLQNQAGLDIISIPYLNLPLADLQRIIKDLKKDIEKIGKTPLFYIDMKYEHFSRLIPWLVNLIGVDLIGLLYKSFASASNSYGVLSEFVDRDVAFAMVDVKRVGTLDFATMHSLPFLGNDLYSVETPHPSHSKEPSSDPRINKIKLFRKFELTITPIKSVNRTANLLEEIGKDQDAPLQEMISHVEEVNTDIKKYHALNGFSRVHELITSTNEFGNFRKYIKSDSSADYVKEKTLLEKILSTTGQGGSLTRFTKS